jgi:hypothetical protein
MERANNSPKNSQPGQNPPVGHWPNWQPKRRMNVPKVWPQFVPNLPIFQCRLVNTSNISEISHYLWIILGAGNVNFWSINVNYIGQPISLAIAMIGSLLLMVN